MAHQIVTMVTYSDRPASDESWKIHESLGSRSQSHVGVLLTLGTRCSRRSEKYICIPFYESFICTSVIRILTSWMAIVLQVCERVHRHPGIYTCRIQQTGIWWTWFLTSRVFKFYWVVIVQGSIKYLPWTPLHILNQKWDPHHCFILRKS